MFRFLHIYARSTHRRRSRCAVCRCSNRCRHSNGHQGFTIFFLVLRMLLPLFRRYSVCNACSISAKISLTFSMPTDRRIKSGVTPHSTNSLSESWRCVEDAGCNTQVRASATCVTIAASFKEFINFSAASLPPLTPNEITPQVPLGIYFWASAWYLLSGSPG